MWDNEERLRKGPVQLFETRRKGLKKVQSSCVGQVVPVGICPALKIQSKLIHKKVVHLTKHRNATVKTNVRGAILNFFFCKQHKGFMSTSVTKCNMCSDLLPLCPASLSHN